MKDRQLRAQESRREREFYAYYEPFLSVSDANPPLCDLNDPESIAAHHATSSPDRALTAFTQLAALRLQARRAMLFFFDANYAYILAESTRTLSLEDDSLHGDKDELWLGSTKIPRGFSVCEVTVNLPVNEGSNAHDPKTSSIVHIINDLRDDTRFCGRPYVQGGPLARFYAGVPITTPKGINIGAFCVLDDKTREGLSEEEVGFLRDMAGATMSHLEMMRAKVENQRSRDMTAALGAFVAGKASLEKPTRRRSYDQGKAQQSEPRERPTQPTRPSMARRRSSSMGPKVRSPRRSTHQSQRKSTRPGNFASGRAASDETVTKNGTDKSGPAPSPEPKEKTQEDLLLAKVQSSLGRAAGLLRDSMDVDGVMFLDASVSTFGGLVDGSRGLNETDSSAEASVSEKDSTRFSRTTEDTASFNDKYCTILASSATGKSESPDTPRFKEGFLKGLLRRYPQGRVWNFNEEGDASSDEDSGEGMSTNSANESAGNDFDPEETPSSTRMKRRIKARVKDGRAIQRMFPGVRSLLLVGMWDSRKEGWFASSIIWTYARTRILSPDDDRSFLSAFCDVVLADVGRIETSLVGRSKIDFVSSISHELRSPLHGILGSAEFLQSQQMDNMAQGMIASISSCGTALLDIINNLLDYARIDNASRNSHSTSSRPQDPSTDEIPFTMTPSKHAKSVVFESDICGPLDILTEDAVETTCIGHAYRGSRHNEGRLQSLNKKGLDDSNVVITLNIERSMDSNWMFTISAGAWKRICMNLISNALKFTKSGHIAVNLRKVDEAPTSNHGPRRGVVVLNVSDTGIGMSTTFQNEGLFKAFRQEDGLREGTGLGLNLIAKIAKSQGGSVQVESEKGVGTSITVTMPLEYANPEAALQTVPEIEDAFAGVQIGLVGFEIFSDDEQQMAAPGLGGRRRLLSSIRDSCTHFGMQTYVVQDHVDEAAQVHLVLEYGLRGMLKKTAKGRLSDAWPISDISKRPVIVLCDTQTTALDLQSLDEETQLGANTQYIWQPLGPAKLKKAISTCFERRQSSAANLKSDHSIDNRDFGVPWKAETIVVPNGNTQPAGREYFRSNGRKRSADELGDTEMVSPNGTIATRPFSPTAKARKPNPGNNKSELNGLSVLLVDDNHINLQLLTVYAKKGKYPYLTATDGNEAVEVYKHTAEASRTKKGKSHNGESLCFANGNTDVVPEKPHVIVMDINMPNKNGFEASREIREYEQQHGIEAATIIALTALGNAEAQVKAVSHGIDMFLTKPVRLNELTKILDDIRQEKKL